MSEQLPVAVATETKAERKSRKRKVGLKAKPFILGNGDYPYGNFVGVFRLLRFRSFYVAIELCGALA